MKFINVLLVVVFGLALPCLKGDTKEIKVEVQVTTGASPGVNLSWDQQPGSEPDMQITIYRRELGTKKEMWFQDIWDGTGIRDFTEMTNFEEIAVFPPSVTEYVDTGVETGKHYEYRVHRPAYPDANYDEAATYAAISLDAPLEDQPGTILLVIDQTLVNEMESELRLLELDLTGDGWGVTRLLTPPHHLGDHQILRAEIQAACLANPDIEGLYLFGKVPVARSGLYAPDGHEGTAHETDLYYAELEGTWRDTHMHSETGGEEGSNVPGDGKFDQTSVTRAVDLMVGRVDLSRLTAVRKNEVELLRDYIHKTHAWRNGDRQVPFRALLSSSHLFQEHTWARTLFGPDNVTSTGFQPELNSEAYIWAMDFGDYNGSNTSSYGAVDNRANFFLNFGSHKQKWRRENNPIRLLLAQPNWGLTAGWGARPAWHMHQMAAGWPVGRSHKRTVNNAYHGGEFTPRGNYSLLESQVHINLMGDPTLRLHVAPPPRSPSATRTAGEITLNWLAPVGAGQEGYHIYRSANAVDGYQRITETPLAPGVLTFVDSEAPATGDLYYQIRAIHRNVTHSGAYSLASRAAFAWLAEGDDSYSPPVAHPPSAQVAGPGVPLRLDLPGANQDDVRVIVLTHPENGLIRWQSTEPFYVSKPGFTGTDTLVYRLFDGVGHSESAVLTVTVEEEAPAALLGWRFDRLENAFQETASTLNATGVLPSEITFGSRFTRSSSGSRQSNAILTSNVNTPELTETGWIGWTVTPEPGYALSLDALYFFAAAGDLSADSDRLTPFGMELRASLDDFNTHVVVPVADGETPRGLHATFAGGKLYHADLSGLGLTGIEQDVDFRLYVWDTPNFALGKSGSNEGQQTMDLTLIGSVATNPPVADAGPEQVLSWGYYTVQLDGSASAAPAATYQWTQLSGPTVTLSTANTLQPSFPATTPGVYEFQLQITNAMGVDSDTVRVEITPENSPPQLTAPAPVEVTLGDRFWLFAEAFDPEGDSMTFLWEQLEGPEVELFDAETLTPYFDAAEPGTHRFRLVATSNSVSSEVEVLVQVTSGDLLIYYPFNEGGGSVVTDEAHQPIKRDIITANGTMNWVADGQFEGAYGTADPSTGSFPGLTVPDSDTLPLHAQRDEYTLSLWVRATATYNYNGYLDKRDSTGRQIQIWSTNPLNRLQIYNGGANAGFDTATTDTPLDNGQWHHLVLVNLLIEGTWTTQLYYDSELAVSFPSGALGIMEGVPLRLGEGNRGPKQLDDFRVYARALTEAEIGALYQGQAVVYRSGDAPPAIHTVTFLSDGGTGCRVEGQAYQAVPDGTNSQAVTAVPGSGYLFDGWWMADELLSTESEFFIENATGPATVTARFRLENPGQIETMYTELSGDVDWGETDPTLTGPLADGNGDGTPNLIHLLHGANPLTGGWEHLPRIVPSTEGVMLRFACVDDPRILYEIHGTSDLTDWPLEPLWSGGTEQAVNGLIEFQEFVTSLSPPQRFYRLQYQFTE